MMPPHSPNRTIGQLEEAVTQMASGVLETMQSQSKFTVMTMLSVLTSTFNSEDRFRWNSESGIQVGIPESHLSLTYYSRASLREFRDRLSVRSTLKSDGRHAKQAILEAQEPDGWWLAQLIHHGLPVSLNCELAQDAIRNAIQTGSLRVPRHIKSIEQRLRLEYDKLDASSSEEEEVPVKVEPRIPVTTRTMGWRSAERITSPLIAKVEAQAADVNEQATNSSSATLDFDLNRDEPGISEQAVAGKQTQQCLQQTGPTDSDEDSVIFTSSRTVAHQTGRAESKTSRKTSDIPIDPTIQEGGAVIPKAKRRKNSKVEKRLTQGEVKKSRKSSVKPTSTVMIELSSDEDGSEVRTSQRQPNTPLTKSSTSKSSKRSKPAESKPQLSYETLKQAKSWAFTASELANSENSDLNELSPISELFRVGRTDALLKEQHDKSLNYEREKPLQLPSQPPITPSKTINHHRAESEELPHSIPLYPSPQVYHSSSKTRSKTPSSALRTPTNANTNDKKQNKVVFKEPLPTLHFKPALPPSSQLTRASEHHRPSPSSTPSRSSKRKHNSILNRESIKDDRDHERFESDTSRQSKNKRLCTEKSHRGGGVGSNEVNDDNTKHGEPKNLQESVLILDDDDDNNHNDGTNGHREHVRKEKGWKRSKKDKRKSGRKHRATTVQL